MKSRSVIFKVFLTALSAAVLCLPAYSINEHHKHEGEEEEFAKLFEPPAIKDGAELSVFECAAAAIVNSPKIRRHKYELDIAKHNEGAAKSVYFPVLSAGAGYYNENNSSSVYNNLHYYELPNVRASINQLIYNFGKSSSIIKMEQFNRIAAQYEFLDSICEALFDIKEKYYRLLRAEALLDAAKNNTVKINEHFVKISHGRPDSNTAQTNLKKAELTLIKAQNEYENARVDLANAMFLDKDYKFTIKNTPTFNYNNDFSFIKKAPEINSFTPVTLNFTREEAAEQAYKNSPDLRVLTALKKSAENSLKYAKRKYLPDLTGSVSYGFGNVKEHGEERASNHSLQIGINMEAEANIKEIYHEIKSADAQIKSADNEIDLFKQDLYFAVQRALNNVDKSLREINTAQKEAETAFYALKTADAAYRGNQINYSFLQEAGKDFIEAEEHYIDALYSYNASVIQLEKAMHIHAADIHHKAEHAMRYHADELLEHLNKALACSEKENTKHRHKELEEDL